MGLEIPKWKERNSVCSFWQNTLVRSASRVVLFISFGCPFVTGHEGAKSRDDKRI
ncbi:hypothetical protein GE21DRAFT_1213665 [Neurospora crassa]|nr:hypothetical protein GE21DRAFT_1213665 [Neurospora crassa]